MHFKGAWEKQYSLAGASVAPAPFQLAGRTVVHVATMRMQGEFPAYVTSSLQAVQIPYGAGRLAALLVQPRGGSLANLLAHLSAGRLNLMERSLRDQAIDLSLPTLDIHERALLNEPLSALGMEPAFYSADFSPMLGPAGAASQAIGIVEHAATLKVNRYGTDAAAATGISVIPTSAEVTVRVAFDRPFLFLIYDTETGAILFSAVVNNPAAG